MGGGNDIFADWYEVSADAFALYGVVPEADGSLTRRIPVEIAKTVSDGVLAQSDYGTGGRVRFSTDSAFVSLKAEYTGGEWHTVNNFCVTYGFDLYRAEADGTDVFVDAFCPPAGFDRKNLELTVQTRNDRQMCCYTLNFPCFSGLKNLYLGLEPGSRLEPGRSYRNEKPVVFYGSSITHGAAAGRPGNTYENFISQRYNLHYRNFGFAGMARAEETMAAFLAQQQMCAFVCDYDHNAPDADYLNETHYRLYEVIRGKHSDIPYIMISKPDFFHTPAVSAKRRAVIRKSYEKACAAGDENVYFIDGETLFAGEHALSCTSDGCHPNDLGFYRMSQKIGAVLARALKITE